MKIKLFGFVIAAFILFTGATNWDGVAVIAPAGDLSPESHTIATNAFPINTVVEVTNLENYKTTRVIVASGLPTSGLLATLSRTAAEALGFQDDFVYRIRMIQPSDVVAYSFLRQHGLAHLIPTDETETETETTGVRFRPTVPIIEQPPTTHVAELTDEEEYLPPSLHGTEESPPEPVRDRALASEDPISENTDLTLVLVPSEDRIPEGPQVAIASEDIVPPIETPTHVEPEKEYTFIAEINPPQPTESVLPSRFGPYQVPVISELDHNSWYVQVAAYSQIENLEDTIRRLGMAYPMAIQKVEINKDFFFRLLLGPLLNQGESAAMLKRIQSIGYEGAFVRNGLRP